MFAFVGVCTRVSYGQPARKIIPFKLWVSSLVVWLRVKKGTEALKCLMGIIYKYASFMKTNALEVRLCKNPLTQHKRKFIG